MKEYKYRRVSPGLSGKTGPIVMLLTVLVPFCSSIAMGWLDLLGFSLVLAVTYGIFVFGFSWWPNFKRDKEFLYLEFLGWPVKIPREDFLDVQEIRYLPQKAWLVTAKRITLLHYSYGLLLSWKLVPGFVIWESLSDYADLLAYVKQSIKQAR